MAEPSKGKWTPRALIVAVLACTICAVLILTVASPLFTGEPMTEDARQVVKEIMLVIIGGVLHWLTEPPAS